MCRLCGKSFSQIGTRNVHMKKQHADLLETEKLAAKQKQQQQQDQQLQRHAAVTIQVAADQQLFTLACKCLGNSVFSKACCHHMPSELCPVSKKKSQASHNYKHTIRLGEK